MINFSPFLLVTTALTVNAAHSLRYHNAMQVKRLASLSKRDNATWSRTDHFQGESFFDNFDFFHDKDPTNGYVNYLSSTDAKAKNLAYVQADGTVIMGVDDKTTLGDGQYRNSVRITSKNKYSGGLFIADFYAMPHGCGVWPAWWSTNGENWPAKGEIDVVEGVHNGRQNQMTLHTGQACVLDEKTKIPKGVDGVLGNFIGQTTCQTINGNNNGCPIQDPRKTSYGEGFNRQAGGVFAHLWDDNGIKMWYFPRDDIPCDLLDEKPDPFSWDFPVATFKLSGCDMKTAFQDHQLILNTALCGDWAGSAGSYGASGCPGTCAEAIKNPANFKYAKWAINYISVYQLK